MSLKQLIHFTNDAGALEKILRLLQSISQVLAVYPLTSEDAKTWLLLRRQFALGRRYIRFFRWMDCLSKTYVAFGEETGWVAVLGVGKWSCMGAFLFLESVTILDVMGVWETEWTKWCLVEANRFWFYALVFSLLWGIVQLFALNAIGKEVELKEKGDDESSSDEAIEARRKTELEKKHKRAGITRRLVVDGLDLLIPGHVVGWIVTSAAVTGVAGSISTVLSMKDVWDKLI
ncbi:peroxin PEX11-1 [Mollisia scopiformis]|uniref:Peroxin PEX11-1 n=1 Tax=Mollisia scopiformis TaxID=149040 RepID=A0A194XNV4_MOLSC|nr:peroxin PEX11-1 [Mollisia scopiformis]KUJ21915.1 peroxin PEX11-1 [Mollisia scopiformis]